MSGWRSAYPPRSRPKGMPVADAGRQGHGRPAASPTEELVQQLLKAYRYFNRELFGDTLPEPVITLSRKANTEGYFSANRFIRRDETTSHEIGLNPATFATRSLMHVLGTLVREMVHVSTEAEGKSGRKGYHNKHWAGTMEAVGLIPTSTGELGGKKTGGKVKHLIVKDGPFETAAKVLIDSGFEIPWLDRYPVPPIASDSSQVMGAELMRKSKLEVGVEPDAEPGDPEDIAGTEASPTLDAPAWPVHEPMFEPAGNPHAAGSRAAPDEPSEPRGPGYEAPGSTPSPTVPIGLAKPEPLIVVSNGPANLRLSSNSKYKFKCPQCSMQAWAKKSARLMCGDHQVAMDLLEPSQAPLSQSD